MWLWEVLLPGRRLSSEGGRTEELTPGQQGWSRAGAKDLLSGRQSREETMEPRPASPCTEHTLRQGLLISALLLTFWNPVTTAKLTIESVPNYAVEGKNLLLQVHNLPDKLQGYFWYKGEIGPSNEIARLSLSSNISIPGPVHNGTATIQPNGSLLIKNVTMNHTGVYILQTLNSDFGNEEASLEIHVYPLLPKPYISSNNSNPVEGKDSVALTCEPETQNTTYQWRINGQNFSDDDRLELSEGNRILTLLSVLRNDTGPYECETWNPVSANRSDPFTLNVIYGPDVPIMSPPGSYFRLGTNLTLSCYAASHPPAQYSWLINEEAQSSSQELFIPNITTNHSGSYTCLAHNSDTGLNKTTVKNITVLEPVTEPSIKATNITVQEQGSVTFTCLSNDTEISIQWIFNNQNLPSIPRITLSNDNRSLSIDPVTREDAGDYQCEISNPVSSMKSNPVHLAVMTTDDPNSGLSPGAIAGIVVGVVAGVALIGALAYFLYFRKTGGGSDQNSLTEHTPSASNHSPGPSDNAPKKTDEVSYSVLNFNDQKLKQPTSAPVSPTTETIYSQVKK